MTFEAGGSVDALARHLALWERLDPCRDVPASARAAFDAHDAAPAADDQGFAAHARFAAECDAPAHDATQTDPARCGRYTAALARVCDAARRGEPLDPALVAAVQGVVLGQPAAAAVRTRDAFARGGAHVYPARADLAACWHTRLAAWERSMAHPAARAAGLYLDVIFLHPFDDGNARAARLWAHFVLARAARAVPDFAGVVAMPKVAGDEATFWRLARVIALGAVAASGTSSSSRCPDRTR